MLTRMPLLIVQRLTKTASFQVTKCQFCRLASDSINSALRKGLVFNNYKHYKVYGIYSIRYKSTDNTSIEEILEITATNTPQSSNVPETPVVANASSSTELLNEIPGSNVLETPVVANATSSVELQNKISGSNVLETPVVANATSSTELLNEIPDPPVPVVEEVIQQVIQLNAHGEPTFSSLGLGGYGPIGLMQYYLEWFHVTTNLPWWATVIITSLVIKLIVFPCTLSVQKNTAKLQHVLPGLVQLQENMTNAKRTGNMQETSFAAYELQEFLNKNKVSIFPRANLIRIGIHVPMFMALREMANLPVESLKTGGLWWFTDLTCTDPYYLLPICTSVTLYLVTEYSISSSPQAQKQTTHIKYILRLIPCVSFLFSMHFPGIVLCHWATSNLVTIMETNLMKINAVKKFFNIPLPIEHPIRKASTAKPQRSFSESLTESWQNMQISSKLAAQARADMIRFNEAGKGPLKKTYKYNPKAPSASMYAGKK